MTLRWFGRIDALAPAEMALLLQRAAQDAPFPDVSGIEREVRERGDAALVDLTEKFDKIRLKTLEVPKDLLHEATERLSKDVLQSLHAAKANIERYHKACMPASMEIEVTRGMMTGRRIVPMRRVGIYVPGGRAAYPSTVLMTVVPAKVAGVKEIIVCTPPPVADATLAACAIAGADRVFLVGGAQAIFAMARGTQSVPRVDKIVGPGNAWVAAAKARVAGEVAIDAPAGPSEVLILADATANAELAAREMLAQAEHDPDAACVAVALEAEMAKEIRDHVERLLKEAPRSAIVRASLSQRGAVLVATNEDELVRFADEYAAEHLVILTREPRVTLSKISNYGSAFLGPWSSVALGDYVSGPNHVLPTAGLARSYSPLSVEDFVRRPTHQAATREAVHNLGPTAERLATLEGLHNHAAAIKARREQL